MPDIRRLLLTGTAPIPHGVGGIFLHDLAGFLPKGMLSVVHVADAAGGGRSATPNGDPMLTLSVPYQRRPVSRWGKPGRLLDWLRMTRANRRSVAQGVRDCVAYSRSQHISEIWSVLDTPASIAMAAPVAKALNLPLRVLVWDDIEHNVGYFGLDRFTANASRRSFEQAIRRADSLAVIGETMQAEYQRRYGKRGVIVRHGLDTAAVEVVMRPADGPIRIGFAGSVSARSAFKCLLEALDALSWAIDGREVTLVLMGQRFDLWSNVPRRIECLGYQRSVEDVLGILAGCTINYLPQPFEASWRPFSELSFPSKLTTYLAAGAPILLHAPPHASLSAFFSQHPFGALCDVLDASALAQSLQRLCVDEALRTAARTAATRALAEDFSVARFRASFAEFIGLDRKDESDHAGAVIAESSACG
ncbi:MAG: glycosyltransferase [Thermomonas sp.]|uniref:glycosyltransferase n=1 Tax=Thermomonas sp. TaxID=1971895 RepID=UPI001D6D55CE|nr:glycosyltransferase [Thermomonas sp.]MBZ0087644.1 glycosyltransferase [Thermomonas sp.]